MATLARAHLAGVDAHPTRCSARHPSTPSSPIARLVGERERARDTARAWKTTGPRSVRASRSCGQNAHAALHKLTVATNEVENALSHYPVTLPAPGAAAAAMPRSNAGVGWARGGAVLSAPGPLDRRRRDSAKPQRRSRTRCAPPLARQAEVALRFCLDRGARARRREARRSRGSWRRSPTRCSRSPRRSPTATTPRAGRSPIAVR